MTDFHHSLDRALDDEHPYAWAPPADTSIVDNFPRTESADHQQWLDDSLWDMALEEAVAYDDFMLYRSDAWRAYLRRNPPELDEPVAYDGFGAPLYAHQIPAEGTE